MYFTFSMLKPCNMVARRAPPVPTSAVIKPVTLPPATNVPVFAGNFNPGLTKKDVDVTTRKMPKISFSKGCGRTPIRKAPRRLKRTPGTQNWIINFLSKPCLKKVILARLPKRWNIATRIIAVLKSTKNKASGRNIVDEPNPAIVPIISAIRAEMKNSISSST